MIQRANYAPIMGGGEDPPTPLMMQGAPNTPKESISQIKPKKFIFPAFFALKCGPVKLILEIDIPDIDRDHHRNYYYYYATSDHPPLMVASPLRQNR